jgi:arylsulfatase A-like enzyme
MSKKDDVVLVTADSIRFDEADQMDFVSQSEVIKGTANGHYTRASLASLLSSSYESALEGVAATSALPSVLRELGYTTIGFSPNANTAEAFGFGAGFDEYESFSDPGRAPNKYRQYLSKFELTRRIYYRLNPPYSKWDDLPSDDEIIDRAISAFNEASKPRFLWIHLMESHRPYGLGEDAITKDIRRKALFSPNKMSPSDNEQLLGKYRNAIGRVDANVERLLNDIDSDPTFVFTSDHGECFGEGEFYFHQPHLLRVPDALLDVPVTARGIDLGDGPIRLIDIAPAIVDAAGGEVPRAWDGSVPRESDPADSLTLARWGDETVVRWTDLRTRKSMTIRGDVVSSELSENGLENSGHPSDEALKSKLRDLGYVS